MSMFFKLLFVKAAEAVGIGMRLFLLLHRCGWVLRWVRASGPVGSGRLLPGPLGPSTCSGVCARHLPPMFSMLVPPVQKLACQVLFPLVRSVRMVGVDLNSG
eukprot:643851-Amphidinium_carterae.7